MSDKPRTRFCWHCAKQLQGNHFREYESENGTVIVHAQCLRELQSDFRTTIAIDDADSDEEFEYEIWKHFSR